MSMSRIFSYLPSQQEKREIKKLPPIPARQESQSEEITENTFE